MLFEQKYANTIRTVSGTLTAEPTDVVLDVTTSSVAATITLQEFTSGLWSTQYKLYIRDASNNAGTNNITILAPSGYTINGAASAIINVNGGSAIIRIVGNLTYQAQLSSFSSTSLPLPYMYNKKLMQDPTTTYVAIAGGTVHSVVSGATQSTYDSAVNNNLTGFNASTGTWIVPTTGYYSLTAKMVIRINNSDVDEPTNGAAAYWMTAAPIDGGIGFLSIGIIKRTGGGAGVTVITAEKQAISQLISDVNIECSQNVYPLTAGDEVSVSILNKTNYAIIGISASDAAPECALDFSAIKIS